MDYNLQSALLKFLAYCEENDWSGYEPYDALNSRVVAALPFLNFRIPRLILTQTLKRSPINARRLLQIPKTQNPKAIALFLSAFLRLSRIGIGNEQGYVEMMINRLIALRSENTPYWCWGYNFPWQTRTVLVPRWAPNLVCTYFAGNALLDAYEQTQETRYLTMGVSAAEYILNELFWDSGSATGFSYPLPSEHGTTHNANFLAAALLCRAYKYTGLEKFLPPAFRVARFSASRQQDDGSWYYGDEPTQRWIDNFHTGFNLGALRCIDQYAGTTEFESRVRHGFQFYRANFYCPDGSVKYFHDRAYPLDTHCVAQSIITPLELKDLDPENVALARSAFQWAMQHMWDEKGFFYYRILRTCTIRTSYMRWTQAWMFLAMTMLLCESARSASPQTEQSTLSVGAV